MPNTRITKTRISEHLQYSKKVYIFGLILAVLAASLVFDMTRHTPSGAQLIQIALVDSYCDTTKLDDDLPALLEKAQARDPAVEEVSFLSVAYSGDSSDDYYGAQVYMVQLYAGGNDIWVESKDLTEQQISSGAIVALDELEGFETFVKNHPDVALLWGNDPSYTTSEEDDDTESEADIPQHVYAIDASSLLGMNQRGAYDVREKYLSVSVTAENADYVFETLSDLFDQFPYVETEEETAAAEATAEPTAEATAEATAEPEAAENVTEESTSGETQNNG